ncbi:zinc finger protein 239-like [Pimephales promelas]|nr:zinc finger protein 239-like [Pimephales promelas]
MAFVEVEIEDTSDSELSRIDHEDTEEQTDGMEVKEQRRELNKAEEEHSARDSRERVQGLLKLVLLQSCSDLEGEAMHAGAVYSDPNDFSCIVVSSDWLTLSGPPCS